jgi:alanyl-tRNA synthetase
MKAGEIRKKYLDFFEGKGHVIVPSAPLLPENDPTTLFTGSGMQPMLQYFLGTPHPLGKKITDSQKSFRAGDIDEIGDNRHTTFFEMLGNWSFGDYFKEEQIPWMFDFLTNEIGLDPKKLYVTCFRGNNELSIPRDVLAAEIWQKLFIKNGVDAAIADFPEENGMQGARIFYYDEKKNWWSRVGVPTNMSDGEPGGPDTEMFWDFGIERSLHEMSIWKDEECHVNCDCGRFVEIGNNVFMQYIKTVKGFELLPKPNVDFGGGLERIAMAVHNNPDIFKIDLFDGALAVLEEESGSRYGENEKQTKAFRVILDHMRAATFLIADGVIPSNTDQGYVLRRLLRRAVRFADTINHKHKPIDERNVLSAIAEAFIKKYEGAYPTLALKFDTIIDEVAKEEKKFRQTLERGLREFNKLQSKSLSGMDVATLYQTFGFPFEVILEIAEEQGIEVDINGFKEEMLKHRDLSRSGSEMKFKGGLIDSSEKTTRLHTAHHLLLKALQIVLGPDIHQRGSNITQERLRIDFNYGAKMTEEQKKQVEEIVNTKIKEGIAVLRTEMTLEDAEKLGAEHEFNAKYPERVSVYSVGPLDAPFSIEFCGGPHVANTNELGHFKILKEEAVASGIRRIKAVLDNS